MLCPSGFEAVGFDDKRFTKPRGAGRGEAPPQSQYFQVEINYRCVNNRRWLLEPVLIPLPFQACSLCLHQVVTQSVSPMWN
jgi:hypothetical protein